MNLQLSLKKNWFEMTKKGIKTEDYRDLTPYWVNRFLKTDLEDVTIDDKFLALTALKDGYTELEVLDVYGIYLNMYETNTMTLGYPKKTDNDRILKIKHKGIEIRTGNPEWGAEPNKIYFVIKHGAFLNES